LEDLVVGVLKYIKFAFKVTLKYNFEPPFFLIDFAIQILKGCKTVLFKSKMLQGGAGRKVPKKCHVLFE